MTFDVAVKQGDILILRTELEKVGRGSLQIRVTAPREDPTTGEARRVYAPCSPSWPWTGMGAPRRCPP